jgi:hypothetical protein
MSTVLVHVWTKQMSFLFGKFAVWINLDILLFVSRHYVYCLFLNCELSATELVKLKLNIARFTDDNLKSASSHISRMKKV